MVILQNSVVTEKNSLENEQKNPKYNGFFSIYKGFFPIYNGFQVTKIPYNKQMICYNEVFLKQFISSLKISTLYPKIPFFQKELYNEVRLYHNLLQKSPVFTI
eukprot:TRINITY_DN12549_c0_g1_i1.p2 TRINITY_DN12549_c0_g1~~TRINITY_DN12549_c0_g1_i1.p2  ORF type:complete len:103 (-),score=1.45 TRINITY_DN12549_c0_g1_i1:144-452(-)